MPVVIGSRSLAVASSIVCVPPSTAATVVTEVVSAGLGLALNGLLGLTEGETEAESGLDGLWPRPPEELGEAFTDDGDDSDRLTDGEADGLTLGSTELDGVGLTEALGEF